MPPELALFLCTGFVCYLLRLDRQQSPGVSAAVWLPTLWLFSIGTKPLGRWLGSASGDEWGSPWDQYFGIGILCLGVLILARRRFDWCYLLRRQPWLVALLGYMLVSCLWADWPFVCLKRGTRQVLAVVMAAVVVSEPDPPLAVEKILLRFAYFLLPFSLLLIKYYPHLGVEFGRWSGERMWVGVAQQKNGLARVCIIALIFLIWRFIQRGGCAMKQSGRYALIAESSVLVLGLYMLFLPAGKKSATSIAAFALAVVVLLVMGWLWRRAIPVRASVLSMVLVSIIAFGIALPLSGGRIGSGFNMAIGRDETFTGRADTWAELVPIAMQHPVLGCGFDSYWTPITRELHQMSHGHSAYLEVFNELGVVGFALFTLYWISVAQAARLTLTRRFDWGALCFSYLFMALLHGMAESCISSFTGQLGGVVLLLGASCTRLSSAPKAEDGNLVDGDLCRGSIHAPSRCIEDSTAGVPSGPRLVERT